MKEILIEYIQDKLIVGSTGVVLEADEDLLGSGLVDSIGMMNLIAFIEERFNFKVPPQDMTIENFMTVEAISDYLEGKNLQ